MYLLMVPILSFCIDVGVHGDCVCDCDPCVLVGDSKVVKPDDYFVGVSCVGGDVWDAEFEEFVDES